MKKTIHSALPATSMGAMPLPTPREQVLLTGPRRSCVTIMEIDEEEGALWDAIVEQRGGRFS